MILGKINIMILGKIDQGNLAQIGIIFSWPVFTVVIENMWKMDTRPELSEINPGFPLLMVKF